MLQHYIHILLICVVLLLHPTTCKPNQSNHIFNKKKKNIYRTRSHIRVRRVVVLKGDEESSTVGPTPVLVVNQTFRELKTRDKIIIVTALLWVPLAFFLWYFFWDRHLRTRTWLVFAAEAKFPALTDRSPVEVILNFRFGNRENGEYRLSFAEDMIVSEVLMAFDGRDHAVDTRVAEVLGQEDFAFSAREVVLYGLAYIPPEDRVEEEGDGDNAASLTATRVSSLQRPFGI